MNRNSIGNIVRVFASVIVAVLAGCSSTPSQIVDYDLIEFKGDKKPSVTSSQALSGDFSSLTEGETLVVAVASDGSGALSQPTIAVIDVKETVLSSSDFNKDLIMERCDPDGDGIIDVFCPELANSMSDSDLVLEKYVTFQSWYMITQNKKLDEDAWGSQVVIDRADIKERETPFYLKMLTINRGNKAYRGDLSIYVNIPPQMTFGEIRETSKVKDRRKTKAALGMIPLVSLFSDKMSNYGKVKTLGEFTVEEREGGNFRLNVKDVELKPGEGINLEYSAIYTVSD